MRSLTTLMAAALALATPGAALAGVVVAASGPSAATYPVGKRIANADRIVLRAGDTLTVLDDKGTRVLRGAGSFTLGQQGGPSRRSTFQVLTEQRSAQRVRTGAVRGEASAAALSPTNIWYVDISRPGVTCLADTSRVRLWRGTAEGDASYTVRGAGSGGQTVEFSDGEVLAAWDLVALPLVANSDYRVAGPDGNGALRFVVLDSVPDDPEQLAATLIEKGCTRQLDILTSALMTEG